MTRSAARATRWSRTGASFAADLALYLVIALAFWLVLPMLALGWTPVLITSGSMSPAVEPGDILLVQHGAPDGEWYVPGTIITYLDRPGTTTGSGAPPPDVVTREGAEAAGWDEDEGRLVTHRVARLEDGAYVTRGDANSGTDPRRVAPEQVVGAARLLIPYLGLPVHWARDGRLMQLSVVALALAGTVLASRWDGAARRREPEVREQDLEVVASDGARTELPAGDDPPNAADPGHFDEREAARLGAIAARAARAGATSSRPPRTEDEPEEAAPTRRRAAGGTRGLPPAGAILGILALTLGGTSVPSHAAFTDGSANSGNSFSTAPADQPPEDGIPMTPLQLPLYEGAAILQGGVGGGTTITYEALTFADDLHLAGDAAAALYLRRQPGVAGNSPGSVEVTLSVDGQPLASGGVWNVRPGDWPDWQLVEIPLSPAIILLLAAGTELQVEVHLDRIEMEVDGPSSIQLRGS